MNPALASVGVGVVVIGLAALVGPPRSEPLESVSLQVVGSETVRPLLAACAESFMEVNPRADVIVRGGGSGDGIASLLHGIADIGMASRPLTVKERDFASAKGVELVVSELALDGIAVIVHPSNAVDALDIDQLKRIYSGEIARWSQLGGDGGIGSGASDAGGILPMARAPGSGTAALFSEQVLAGAALSAATQQLATNEAIVAEVASKPSAIGYTSLGALNNADSRVKTVALRAKTGSAATLPSVDSVRARAYPLTRTLYLIGADPRSTAARSFVAHCTGPAGRAMIQRMGHVAMQAAFQ